MMTIEQVREKCRKIAINYGHKLVVPVEKNGRLRTTYGRVLWKKDGNKCVPQRIEFSSRLLRGDNDEIDEVIRHEMAHYLLLMDTHENHNHDYLWRKYAKRLGCDPRAAINMKSVDTGRKTLDYKYIVKCPSCGRTITKYKMITQVVRHPEHYRTRCCKEIPKIYKIR